MIKAKYLRFFAFIALILFVFGLRVYAISDRPFHNDEGVNFLFVKEIFSLGYYRYSYENYHGPAYFYFLTLTNYLLGINDLGMRMSAILPIVALSTLILFSFNYVSVYARVFIIGLIAVGTTSLFYSRYAIHEPFLVFSCIMTLHFGLRWLLCKRFQDLLLACVGLGLQISTKETFIIHTFSIVVSLGLVFSFPKVFKKLFKDILILYWGLILLILIVILFFSGFFQYEEGLRQLFMGIEQWVDRAESDKGHHKAYHYYFDILKELELLSFIGFFPAIFFLLKIFYAFVSYLKISFKTSKVAIKKVLFLWVGKVIYFYSLYSLVSFIVYSHQTPWLLISMTVPMMTTLGIMIDHYLPPKPKYLKLEGLTDLNVSKVIYVYSLYSLVSFVVYSSLPYKTPWLLISMTVPMLITLGIMIDHYLPPKYLKLGVFFFVFIYSTKVSLGYNYLPSSLGILNQVVENYDVIGSDNPLAYVHGSKENIPIAEEIISYVEERPGARVLIGSKSYWPMPYYLRQLEGRLRYHNSADPLSYAGKFEVMIVNSKPAPDLRDYEKKYFRLADNQECALYFRK